jgi:hypothetical protein
MIFGIYEREEIEYGFEKNRRENTSLLSDSLGRGVAGRSEQPNLAGRP